MKENQIFMEKKAEIAIVGFPKCGTTALLRCFEEDAEMRVMLSSNGSYELTWPKIRDIPQDSPDGRIVAHKYATYIYNRTALEHLAKMNAGSVIVLCIRDPLRSLVSWHSMHRRIARRDEPQEHFAWREREFYADCTIEDYYQKFAQTRLRYDHYLDVLLSIVPTERVAVVSQERMAQGINSVAQYLKGLARGEPVLPGEAVADEGPSHVAFADNKTDVADSAIRTELEGVRHRLNDSIQSNVRHHCL